MIVLNINYTDLRKLYEEGLNDRVISETLGCNIQTVRFWRVRNSKPPNRSWEFRYYYKVYDKASGELLVEGLPKKCSEYLNIAEDSFRSIYCKSLADRRGLRIEREKKTVC